MGYCYEFLTSLLFQEAPVWEISGAEFTKSTTHTADGISIRFPRVTRIRDDKDWETATDLVRLKVSSLHTSVHVFPGSMVQWNELTCTYKGNLETGTPL